MENRKPFAAVIFDLDGTLLDTLEDIAFTLNTILEAHGFPAHSLDACRFLVGHGMQELVRRALPEGVHDDAIVAELLVEMQDLYAKSWNIHTKPYEGIDRLLDALTEKGIKKAILSNKPDRFTKLCAESLLSRWQFDAVLGHHDGIAHKPDPEGALLVAQMLSERPSSILYAGDSGIDMQTARAAGMYPVGVLWGFRPEGELRASGAACLAETPDDMIGMLDRA
jgi:phosphoglycolate phosphatase